MRNAMQSLNDIKHLQISVKNLCDIMYTHNERRGTRAFSHRKSKLMLCILVVVSYLMWNDCTKRIEPTRKKRTETKCTLHKHTEWVSVHVDVDGACILCNVHKYLVRSFCLSPPLFTLSGRTSVWTMCVFVVKRHTRTKCLFVFMPWPNRKRVNEKANINSEVSFIDR